MIDFVTIIPAAGKATRFGGVLKELLPISNDHSLMSAHVGSYENIGTVVVVTTPEKISEHAKHLQRYKNVDYVLQDGNRDAWSAIYTAINRHEAHRYIYAMPDTYLEFSDSDKPDETDFGAWTFCTKQPERYGCIVNGYITDKDATLAGTTKIAWGMLTWTTRVRDLWVDTAPCIVTHTHAFNMAIAAFGISTAPLSCYHDIASWDDYRRLVTYEL